MDEYANELEAALDAIHSAGDAILKLYESFEKIEDAPADISTEADRVSQELIIARLSAAFPDDGFCAEETMKEDLARPRPGQRIWVIDPIDGSRGFARKNGEFSVMIGLVEREDVILGAVYEPAIDRLTYAAAGRGCVVCQGESAVERRQTSRTARLEDATMSMSRSRKGGADQQLLSAFGAKRAVQTYSAGIKLAQVARGETDLYLGDYLTLHDWDVCAGHILVTEAGGTVTNIHGEPIRYRGHGASLEGKGLIATNGRLHEAALAVLRSGKVPF